MEAVTRHWNGINTVYFHKSEVTDGFSTDISAGTNAIGPDNLVVRIFETPLRHVWVVS